MTPTTPAGLRYRNTFDQLVEAGLMDERTALSLKSGLLAIEQEAAALERKRIRAAVAREANTFVGEIALSDLAAILEEGAS